MNNYKFEASDSTFVEINNFRDKIKEEIKKKARNNHSITYYYLP